MSQNAAPMTMEHRGYTATVEWDEEAIRIISARRATGQERRRYDNRKV